MSEDCGNVSEDLKTISEFLERYETSLNMPKSKIDSRTEEYLTMPREQLSKLSRDDLGEIGFMLRQYGFYLQKEANKLQAIISWVGRKIDWLVVNRVAQQGSKFEKGEHKLLLAIRENDVAAKLYKVKTQCESKLQLLAYIPTSIGGMCSAIDSLQQIKRGN